MEGYIVSARKYRPDTFESVVGQSHITLTLQNAIVTNQLAHAFLFSGPRGVGKTTCARILAKAINCTNLSPSGEPCNACDSCNHFNEGRSLNIHELDAASNNSVDDIRNIIEQVRYIPATGRKSVFIIDEVHMLSAQAFNAFLKTLEEPPSHVIFILATTEKHKILPTILSRCQKFDFRRIKVNDTADHLKSICEKEGIQFEYEALQLISLKADGALRDALSMFDQIVSFSNKNVTFVVVQENLNILDADFYFRAVDLALAQDHQGMLLLLDDVINRGFEARDFLMGLTEHYRNLLMCKTPQTVKLIETADNIRQRYLSQTQSIDPSLLLNAFQLCSEADQKLKLNSNQRLGVELLLAKLAYLQQAVDLADSLLSSGVEKKKESGELRQTPQQNPLLNNPAKQPAIKNEVPPVSKPLVAKNPAGKSKMSIPTSLENVVVEEKKKSAGGNDAEEEVTVFDDSVSLNEESLLKSLNEIRIRIEAQGKPRVSVLLTAENVRIEHNRIILRVDNEVSKKGLLEEKNGIVTFLRESLNQPSLYMDILVEESSKKSEKRPMTNAEKLDKMREKNPELNSLMSKFDTMTGF